MLLREYAIKWWFVIPPLIINVSALPEDTWTPEIVSFQSCCIPCLENDTALACCIFDINHLSICRPHSPPARRRTPQCSPVLRQQWTPSATRRTLADNEAGVHERCRASSHSSACRRNRSASWLSTLQWTLFRPRRRRSPKYVPGIFEAAAAVSFSRHGIGHAWKDTISGVLVSSGSADTLVRTGGVTNHYFDSILSQQHLCQNHPIR